MSYLLHFFFSYHLRIKRILLLILVLSRNIAAYIKKFIDIAVDDYQEVSSTQHYFKNKDWQNIFLSLYSCLNFINCKYVYSVSEQKPIICAYSVSLILWQLPKALTFYYNPYEWWALLFKTEPLVWYRIAEIVVTV